MALRLRVNPEVVRRTEEGVIVLALLMGKAVDEVEGWDARDRRWLLALHRAEVERPDATSAA